MRGLPDEFIAAQEQMRRGDVQAASKSLEAGIARRPKDHAVYAAAAQLCLAEGRPEIAIKYAERGLGLSRKPSADIQARLHSLKGMALLELGDAKGSIASHRAALELMPDEPQYMNNLAYALAEAAESDAALAESERLVNEAIERAVVAQAGAETLGVFLDTLGWAQFRSGDLRRASVNLTQAADLVPDEPEVLFHLASVRLAEGRRDDAVIWLKRALKLRPAMAKARRLLEEISPRRVPRRQSSR